MLRDTRAWRGRVPQRARNFKPLSARVMRPIFVLASGTSGKGIALIVEHPESEHPETRTSNDIRVDTISEHEWRICDRRIPHDDARSLLGFIELTHGRYEVMEFADPVRFSFCTCLDDAVAAFARSAAVVTTGAQAKDAAILRFPRPRPAA
ncbi:MAG: hypothetical protein ABWX59_09990 [Microbacteriaceae bacterium]